MNAPIPAIIARLVVFAVLWWALTEGDTYNLWFGAIIVILATVVSVVLFPATGLRLWHLLGLVPWFLRMSITGGIDVARRAFAPSMPLDPGIIDAPLRLPDGPPRVLVANILGLTPGTVSVEILPETLRIHMLDQGMEIEGRLRELEEHVARIFGIDLDEETAN